jgi:hypothetical protein
VLILDMIEVLPPLGKYKYNTWRILLVECYIDNSVHLQSYIRNVNTAGGYGQQASVQTNLDRDLVVNQLA